MQSKVLLRLYRKPRFLGPAGHSSAISSKRFLRLQRDHHFGIFWMSTWRNGGLETCTSKYIKEGSDDRMIIGDPLRPKRNADLLFRVRMEQTPPWTQGFPMETPNTRPMNSCSIRDYFPMTSPFKGSIPMLLSRHDQCMSQESGCGF